MGSLLFAGGGLAVLTGIVLLCGPTIDCMLGLDDCYTDDPGYYGWPSPAYSPSIAPSVAPSVVAPSPSPSADVRTEQQWNQITQARAERSCTAAAKNAVGFPDSLGILSCTCSVSETPTMKTFRCNVNAVDNAPHPVLLVCFKAGRICTVTSEKGTDAYTFDELERLTGENVGG